MLPAAIRSDRLRATSAPPPPRHPHPPPPRQGHQAAAISGISNMPISGSPPPIYQGSTTRRSFTPFTSSQHRMIPAGPAPRLSRHSLLATDGGAGTDSPRLRDRQPAPQAPPPMPDSRAQPALPGSRRPGSANALTQRPCAANTAPASRRRAQASVAYRWDPKQSSAPADWRDRVRGIAVAGASAVWAALRRQSNREVWDQLVAKAIAPSAGAAMASGRIWRIGGASRIRRSTALGGET